MKKLSSAALWAFDLVVLATEYRRAWLRTLKNQRNRAEMLEAECKLLALAQRGPK